jgi:hypothetical protein
MVPKKAKEVKEMKMDDSLCPHQYLNRDMCHYEGGNANMDE